ncbi:MAG: type IX secretion system membrane protein PorP/SprF [Saprospiraceae bacterium]|nr:type IX secretion system membrane protein PorP/SprF [Saprospiraceae bacterium]
MTKYSLISLFILICLCTTNAQQQQMYTQFMFNKLSLNPAFAGNDSYTCLTLMYRDQWNGFPGAPKAQLASVNFPRIGKNVGLGMNIERQTIGISEKITVDGMYAYKFILGDGTLSMGMNISGRNFSQDFSDPRLFAIQGIVNDPSIPQTSQNRKLLNAGFGIYFNTNTFFMGAAVPRMIRSDLDFDRNNFFTTEVRHLILMGGGTFILNDKVRLTPQAMLRAAENSPFTMDLNMSASFNEKYMVGLTYRTGGVQTDIGESLDVIFSFQISERLMLGLAHDITLSKIRTIDNGSLEVMLSYCFIPRRIKTVIVNPRYF